CCSQRLSPPAWRSLTLQHSMLLCLHCRPSSNRHAVALDFQRLSI
ncbi:Drug resistance transporter EmrB/QacA subfamily, partial [uncultured Synechococcales cyanobacterium]